MIVQTARKQTVEVIHDNEGAIIRVFDHQADDYRVLQSVCRVARTAIATMQRALEMPAHFNLQS